MTAPLCFGQLSLWRDVQDLPDERLHEPNLAQLWAVAPGTSEAELEYAWLALVRRHASLRTVFDLSDRDQPRQRVIDCLDPAVPGLEPASAGDPVELLGGLAADAFALDRGVGWRARAVLDRAGSASHLAVVVHHLVADGMSMALLRSELPEALRGGLGEAPPGPADLASREQSAQGRRRSAAAVDHWRSLTQATDLVRQATGTGAMCHVALSSRDALDASLSIADAAGVSLSSTLLGAYGVAVVRGTQRPTLIRVMSSNRLDPVRSSVVTSMNQWTVLRVEPDLARLGPVDAARAMARVGMLAFRHGIYDVDDLADALRAVGGRAEDHDNDHSYNFIAVDPIGTDATAGPGPTLTVTPAAYTIGPRLYLRAIASDRLDLVLRVPDTDEWRARATALLQSMHDQLLEEAAER